MRRSRSPTPRRRRPRPSRAAGFGARAPIASCRWRIAARSRSGRRSHWRKRRAPIGVRVRSIAADERAAARPLGRGLEQLEGGDGGRIEEHRIAGHEPLDPREVREGLPLRVGEIRERGRPPPAGPPTSSPRRRHRAPLARSGRRAVRGRAAARTTPARRSSPPRRALRPVRAIARRRRAPPRARRAAGAAPPRAARRPRRPAPPPRSRRWRRRRGPRRGRPARDGARAGSCSRPRPGTACR